MKLIRGIHNIKKYHQGCVLTIGNFDVIHRGHQNLLLYLKKKSKIIGLPVMVMIFEPQPLEFFLGKNAPARLISLRDKIKYFMEYKIDYLLCIKFNKIFASLSPNKFIINILVDKLAIKLLVIGDDFRFGNKRYGNYRYLCKICKKYNFQVINIGRICYKGKRISSSYIRKALSMNNFTLAENFMGHKYRLSGKVISGDKFGNIIGFPTANILYKPLKLALHGVYIVIVYGIEHKALKAVANIGTCPTIKGVQRKIEVHLLDVYSNIYGYHIDIVFCKKLRNEKKFPSIEELIQQIKKDIKDAKHFFHKNYITYQ